MDRPTRQDQARAILGRRGHRMAADILGRRPMGTSDYAEAFNLERIDLISEIPNGSALLALGTNVPGPRDGLYVLDDEGSYRVYLQERGIELNAVGGADFERAREAAVDRIIQLQGLPFEPEG